MLSRFIRRFSRSPIPGKIVALTGQKITRKGVTIDPEQNDIPYYIITKFLLGRYELDEITMVDSVIDNKYNIIELGGGIGVLSCYMNKLLAHPKNHIVIEANPKFIKILEKHKNLNSCKYEISHAAYAPSENTVSFGLQKNSSILGSGLHRDSTRKVEVPAINLEQVADCMDFETYCLVCDIEGSEQELIYDEIKELESRCKLLLVEFHYPLGDITGDDVADSKQKLLKHGFEPIEIMMDGRVIAYKNTHL